MRTSEIPIDNGQHHTSPAALAQQFTVPSAAPLEKLSSLRDCFSDGGEEGMGGAATVAVATVLMWVATTTMAVMRVAAAAAASNFVRTF